MTTKQELRGLLNLAQAGNRTLHRRLMDAESALAGQVNAGRIMMAALDRKRQLLEAYGIEEEWDHEVNLNDLYDWPPPGTLPPPPLYEWSSLGFDNRYVYWNRWLQRWVLPPVGVPS